MIKAFAPGKLYIAGEYAVVEPGHPAIIAAVDQFITVSLKKSEKVGSITSKQYGNLPVMWVRENDHLVLDKRENPFHYILAAIEITEKFVKESGKPLSFYHLSVDSELDSSSGKKYGLGSSAAVTVATVKALLQYYGMENTSSLIVFKLAALAHLSIKSNGSCGDIAASVYGGWLAFSTFDRTWVSDKQEELFLTELVEANWPYLEIESLVPPEDLRLVIGWTGSPASTSHLVDEVTSSRSKDEPSYEDFLKDSKACVSQLIKAFRENNIPMIQKNIRLNRELLKQMSRHTGVLIETPALSNLCDLAEKYNGAAKSSGAGGGDCGIVLFNTKDSILSLITEWEKQDITNLPLHVYTRNEAGN